MARLLLPVLTGLLLLAVLADRITRLASTTLNASAPAAAADTARAPGARGPARVVVAPATLPAAPDSRTPTLDRLNRQALEARGAPGTEEDDAEAPEGLKKVVPEQRGEGKP